MASDCVLSASRTSAALSSLPFSTSTFSSWACNMAPQTFMNLCIDRVWDLISWLRAASLSNAGASRKLRHLLRLAVRQLQLLGPDSQWSRTWAVLSRSLRSRSVSVHLRERIQHFVVEPSKLRTELRVMVVLLRQLFGKRRNRQLTEGLQLSHTAFRYLLSHD